MAREAQVSGPSNRAIHIFGCRTTAREEVLDRLTRKQHSQKRSQRLNLNAENGLIKLRPRHTSGVETGSCSGLMAIQAACRRNLSSSICLQHLPRVEPSFW